MGQAVDIDRFLPTGSKIGGNIENVLTATIIGFAVLASFGMWPAMAYLFYMAMNS